jgi:hypothetical protein
MWATTSARSSSGSGAITPCSTSSAFFSVALTAAEDSEEARATVREVMSAADR